MADRINYGELVECVRQGAGDELVLGAIGLEQHSLDVLPVLEAVHTDYVKVTQLGRAPALEAAQVAAIKAAAGEVYHADVVAHEIVHPDPATIVERLLWVRSHPEAHLGAVVVAGQVWFFEGNLYEAVLGHTIDDPAWLPGRPGAATLWKRYYEPEEGPQPWEQPLGAGYGYLKGARVTHNGSIWESTFEGENVWEPGVFGWLLIGPA